MTNETYLSAINKAQELLTELLEDTDHGQLTFNALNDLEDLEVASPLRLSNLPVGSVLAIGGSEWMLLDTPCREGSEWQNYKSGLQVTSAELYILALKSTATLRYCHRGL